MAPKKKGSLEKDCLVPEGSEVQCGTEEWKRMKLKAGIVIEFSLASSSVGFGGDEWAAMVVNNASVEDETNGWLVGGVFLGCTAELLADEIRDKLSRGLLHLCSDDPCAYVERLVPLVHVTLVRLWELSTFDADYISEDSKQVLQRRIEVDKEGFGRRKETTAARTRASPRTREPKKKEDGSKAKEKAAPRRGRTSKPPEAPKDAGDEAEEGVSEVIEVSDQEYPRDRGVDANGVNREALRQRLREARERMAGVTAVPPRKVRRVAPPGGPEERESQLAVVESNLRAGTSLNPGSRFLTSLREPVVTSGGLLQTS